MARKLGLWTVRNFLWILLALAVLSAIHLIWNFDVNIVNVVAAWQDAGTIESWEERPCKAFAQEVMVGSWRERPGLSKKDYIKRAQMDERIRVRMNWPAKLYRNDSRCGKAYPIPGYRIQSLCDPEGVAPCCNTKTGECGISDDHCKCSECTDLRDFKSAELVEWVVRNPDCAVKNYTAEETCKLFNKWNIRLAFIGDSLVRQLSSMMLILLSDDPMLGAMPANAKPSDIEKCKGEFQITDKDCSIYLASHSTEDARKKAICKGDVNFTVTSAQVYLNAINEEAINRTKELLGVKNSYLVLGVGMHFWLRVDWVINDFLSIILKLIDENGRGWPRIIWIEIHNIDGFLRMETKFSNDKVQAFNKEISKYLEDRNITIVRTFEISRSLKSYDGQHYGFGFNMFKIQLLMNHLAYLLQMT